MGGIEESPTVAAVQDGHFAEPPHGTTESLPVCRPPVTGSQTRGLPLEPA